MSWLFKTLSSVDDPGDSTPSPSPETEATGTPGVKEDLSAIGLTIGRQLRGVASFLAPPPTAATTAENELAADSPSESEAKSMGLLGMQNDLADIGGSLKSGLTILSSNGSKAVGGISRFASSFMPFTNEPDGEEDDGDEEEEEEEEEDEDDVDGYGYGDDHVPGITDEVLQFVTEITKRSECWTDFPLRFDHGFSMSDAQREHASTIEQYIPDFATLRKRLCDSMDEELFWLIYFILLVPRLNVQDSELLSTPVIVKARDTLLQKLHNREAESETDENSTNVITSPDNIQFSENQGHEIQSLKQDFAELDVSDRDRTDKPIDESGNSSAVEVRFGTEDDFTFSDLEDDDSEVPRRLSINKKAPNESNDWVQLSESVEPQSVQRKKDSEGEDSSGWLNVDDFD